MTGKFLGKLFDRQKNSKFKSTITQSPNKTCPYSPFLLLLKYMCFVVFSFFGLAKSFAVIFHKINQKFINVVYYVYSGLYLQQAYFVSVLRFRYHKISLFLSYVPFLQTILPVQRVKKVVSNCKSAGNWRKKSYSQSICFVRKMHLLK